MHIYFIIKLIVLLLFEISLLHAKYYDYCYYCRVYKIILLLSNAIISNPILFREFEKNKIRDKL